MGFPSISFKFIKKSWYGALRTFFYFYFYFYLFIYFMHSCLWFGHHLSALIHKLKNSKAIVDVLKKQANGSKEKVAKQQQAIMKQFSRISSWVMFILLFYQLLWFMTRDLPSVMSSRNGCGAFNTVMASPSGFHNGFWGFATTTATRRLELQNY